MHNRLLNISILPNQINWSKTIPHYKRDNIHITTSEYYTEFIPFQWRMAEWKKKETKVFETLIIIQGKAKNSSHLQALKHPKAVFKLNNYIWRWCFVVILSAGSLPAVNQINFEIQSSIPPNKTRKSPYFVITISTYNMQISK